MGALELQLHPDAALVKIEKLRRSAAFVPRCRRICLRRARGCSLGKKRFEASIAQTLKLALPHFLLVGLKALQRSSAEVDGHGLQVWWAQVGSLREVNPSPCFNQGCCVFYRQHVDKCVSLCPGFREVEGHVHIVEATGKSRLLQDANQILLHDYGGHIPHHQGCETTLADHFGGQNLPITSTRSVGHLLQGEALRRGWHLNLGWRLFRWQGLSPLPPNIIILSQCRQCSCKSKFGNGDFPGTWWIWRRSRQN
mmetsp:Transcript_54269/g.129354  ORF Transcript_54269/g.129354 Transcript_54269/m.129354 type:complete len:253 (+) Transcript_54269:101-859(+)